MNANIHGLLAGSQANGPGVRNVVWFQGCSLHCPGCFNPDTHDPMSGEPVPVPALAERLLQGNPGGITISGGEPFQQAGALLALVEILRKHPSDPSLLVFTGYPFKALIAMPLGKEILNCLDILVAGPYVRALHVGKGLFGSANQSIHLLTPRHRMEEVSDSPVLEVTLHRDGRMSFTGMKSLKTSIESNA